MRVLVIDDVESNRFLPSAILKRHGVEVDDTDSGASALTMLAEKHYDAVLLDISMPGISGIDVCKAIRSNPDTRGIRIVAYTAHAFQSELNEIMSAGFDAVLIKPILKENLLEALLV